MTAHGPIVVTGASGFVGRALVARLGARCDALHLAPDDWRERIRGANFSGATVFHLAARVHSTANDEAPFLRDNRDKTRALAQAAARGGARRLVFVSSSRAMGEETGARPFTLDDVPHPVDAYGRSKLAAEQAIAEVARSTALEYAVVRAPLVLGGGAKGNLVALLRICDSPWPLPFGAPANRRSFVQVDDLARLLVLCAERPIAAGRTYLAAHRTALSTRDLVASIRSALGRAPRLFALPASALERLGAIAGRGDAVRRLTRSLELDPSLAERELGWRAEVSLDAAVREMVAAYRAQAAR